MKYTVGDPVQCLMEGVWEDCEVIDAQIGMDGIPYYQVRHLDTGDICSWFTVALVRTPVGKYGHESECAMTNTITNPNPTLIQLTVWKGAIKLEKLGMKRRGPSVMALARRHFNMSPRSTHDQVLARICEELYLINLGDSMNEGD